MNHEFPSQVFIQASVTIEAPIEACHAYSQHGYSGSPIFRLDSARGPFALRAWPNNASSVEKITYWKKAWAAFEGAECLLKSVGTNPFPEPLVWNRPWPSLLSTPHPAIFPWENQYWSIAPWMPGRSLLKTDLTTARVHQIVATLGQWHSALAHLGAKISRSPGLMERDEAISQMTMPPAIPCDVPESVQRCRDLVANEFGRISDWSRKIRAIACTEVPLHWIVRDLWRENLLLDESTGDFYVVDFGASRIDWPGLDVIRLLGSLYLSREEWCQAIQIYRDSSSVKHGGSAERWMEVHQVSTLVSMSHWLKRWGRESGSLSLHTPVFKQAAYRLDDLWSNWNSLV